MSQAAPPRVTLSILAALHAAVFLAVALTILGLWPWFGTATSLVGLAHAALAVCVLARFDAWRLAWRLAALTSLVWLIALGATLASTALYLIEIYGALGRAIAALSGVVWLLGALFTLPLSAWGLSATGGLRLRSREAAGAAAAALIALIAAAFAAMGATWTPVAPLQGANLGATLERELPAKSKLGSKQGNAPLSLDPVKCPEPVDAERVSVLVHYTSGRARAPRAKSRCVQAANLAAAVDAAARWLRREGQRGATLIDVVTRLGSLPERDPLLGALSLRGGVDGVCAKRRCLSSWQLVARGLVQESAPLPALPEVRFGFSHARLRAALGVADADPLKRVEVASFALETSLTRLARQRRERVAVEPEALRRAEAAAERHIVRAQQRDGSFRYALDPVTGESIEGESLPRQAGTTLVLCELGGKRGRRAAKRALSHFRDLERRTGRGSVLAKPDTSSTTLGSVALPLIALLSCRPAVGEKFDPLIGRMVRVLLALQRDDGGFHSTWSIDQARALDGPPPLFAPGQAVMALLLAERARAAGKATLLPPAALLQEAATRAMDYFGSHYWDHPLAEAFYLEEN
jgi:hypothetical protein